MLTNVPLPQDAPASPAPRLTRWWLVVVFVAFVSGTLLRFGNLGGKIFWFDEVFTNIFVSAHDEQLDINPTIYTGQPLSPAAFSALLQSKAGSNLADIAHLLAIRDTKWPPLYFWLARLWMEAVGSDSASMRGLAAMMGLLTIPAFGWLVGTLYEDRRAALVGMALLALSPIFIRYSQENRPYMMSVLLLLLAHTAFLRVLRTDTARGWVYRWTLYGVLVAAAVYTYQGTALAFAGHAIYLLLAKDYRTRRILSHFLLASAGSILMFMPWLLTMVKNFRVVVATSTHLANGLSAGTTLTLWTRNISHLLFAWEVQVDRWFVWLVFVVIGLVVYACLRLFRDALQRTSLFVIVQLVLPLLVLALPDIIRGGRVSVTDRYFLAAYLAAMLAVVYLVSHYNFWRTAAVVILVGSLISSYTAVQSPTWWEWPQVELDVAAIMNKPAPSLMISQVSFGVVTPLINKLGPNNRIVLIQKNELPPIPEGFSHVYVYQPSAAFLQAISQVPNITLTKIYEEPRWEETVYTLYELRRNK